MQLLCRWWWYSPKKATRKNELLCCSSVWQTEKVKQVRALLQSLSCSLSFFLNFVSLLSNSQMKILIEAECNSAQATINRERNQVTMGHKDQESCCEECALVL